jgi:hypothetical protein
MQPDPVVVRRWRELRQMLIIQLEMFDGGGLTLKSGGVDVSADAMASLKREIFAFDALISGAEVKPAGAGSAADQAQGRAVPPPAC